MTACSVRFWKYTIRRARISFKTGARKYTDEQLETILREEKTPVFVYEDEEGQVRGYAFCIFQEHPNDNILTPIKTLYIDDLCVDQNMPPSAHRPSSV